MKKLTQFVAVLVTAIFMFVACKKNNLGNQEISGQKNTSKTSAEGASARDFVAKNGPQKQGFILYTSELPKTIQLRGGTSITFPKGAFTLRGVPVTGPVTVEALEMLKRSDVILGGTNTNHISGAPLVSDGFIFVDVKSNGVSVDKNLASPIKVSIKTTRTGSTGLWNGVQNAQNQLGWEAPRPGGQKEAQSSQGQFAFDFGNLGWINCDYFYSNTNPKTTMKIEVPNNPGTMATFRGYTGDTFVFFVAQGSNVAAQIYTPAGVNTVKSYDNMMPIGVSGRLIAFSIKNGLYYFVKKDITIVPNHFESLTLAASTEAAIQAEINSLNSY